MNSWTMLTSYLFATVSATILFLIIAKSYNMLSNYLLFTRIITKIKTDLFLTKQVIPNITK